MLGMCPAHGQLASLIWSMSRCKAIQVVARSRSTISTSCFCSRSRMHSPHPHHNQHPLSQWHCNVFTTSHSSTSNERIEQNAVQAEQRRNSVDDQRQQNIQAQKRCAKSIDVVGIHRHIEEEKLADEVLRILNSIDAPVRPEDMTKLLRPKWNPDGVVVCQLKDKSLVYAVMEHAHKLKSKVQLGNRIVYIRPSMSKAYRELRYNYILPLIQEGKIYKLRMGNNFCNQVQLVRRGKWIDIAHKEDLISLGLIRESAITQLDPDEKGWEVDR